MSCKEKPTDPGLLANGAFHNQMSLNICIRLSKIKLDLPLQTLRQKKVPTRTLPKVSIKQYNIRSLLLFAGVTTPSTVYSNPATSSTRFSNPISVTLVFQSGSIKICRGGRHPCKKILVFNCTSLLRDNAPKSLPCSYLHVTHRCQPPSEG